MGRNYYYDFILEDKLKTIKKDSIIKRVSDKKAEKLVYNGENWCYCPKSEWKKLRDKK